MSGDDQLQARMQRMERDLRELQEDVGVMAAVNGEEMSQRIRETFSDARTVIIYRGLQKGLTQAQIGAALKARGLTRNFQPHVSKTVGELEDLHFVEKTPKGSHVPRRGWSKYGLEKVLRKTLRIAGIDDLD